MEHIHMHAPAAARQLEVGASAGHHRVALCRARLKAVAQTFASRRLEEFRPRHQTKND